MQPRVFELFCYLLQHRDRVVSKDELLDEIWSGMVVTEGSLQRAISLIRSALRQGDMANAIRTYARTGYRFCPEVLEQEQDSQLPAIPPLLENARALYRQDNWQAALPTVLPSGFVATGATGSDLPSGPTIFSVGVSTAPCTNFPALADCTRQKS